jgi:hypothetical protein
MGYCIELSEHKFKIKKEDSQAVVEALHEFAKSKERKIMWVDKDPLLQATTILEAFDEIRYQLKVDSNGDFELDYFSGEKYGDDEKILNSIAKYIEPNSYIEFEGEDGIVFQFFFDGENCKYKFIENINED